ncbi:MAG: transcription elongation factor GreA [Anaerolineae bacterium]
MDERPTHLTPEGKKRLQEELEHLRKVRRPEVADRIRQAKEDGDITENAGYDEAKNEQAFLEGRIATLKTLLEHAVLIPEDAPGGAVSLGARVTVEGEDGVHTYRIVGPVEADPDSGQISDESPLGRALLGHQAGDQVEAQTPEGISRYRVLQVR